MGDINLQAIAEARVSDPLNTWPEHRRGHRCTLMGKPLFDYDCLRCWLEKVASEQLAEKKAQAVTFQSHEKAI